MFHSVNDDHLTLARESGLFDADWYLSNYPDVATLNVEPLRHYFALGAQLGREPSPAFDSAKYRRKHGDVPNPLLHYLLNRSKKPDWENPTAEYGTIAPSNIPFLDSAHPSPSFEIISEHAAEQEGSAILLLEKTEFELRFSGTLAIHVHLFHLDMIPETIWWLSSIPVPFDLFISISKETDIDRVERVFGAVPSVNRIVVEAHFNQGRDIAPMVVEFGPRLARYDYVGHFHSKKSYHTAQKSDWGLHLGHHLFHSMDHTTRVLNLFCDHDDLGLIFPIYHPSVRGQIKWGANFKRVADELSRLLDGEILKETDLLPFPAGSFFMARTDAIRSLLEGAFKLEDFEPEAGQIDGTLAHAIERLLVLVASRSGYTFQQVAAEKPHSLGRSYLENGDAYRSPILSQIDKDPKTLFPTYSNPSLKDLKIRFYTCSTGGYEEPLPFEAFVEGADYFFFSDNPSAEFAAQWIMQPLALTNPHPIKTARMHKTQPHRILGDVDVAIWIDGNITVSGDITGLIDSVLKAEASFGVIPHPYRKSVAEELSALVKMGIDDSALMTSQYEKYRSHGFLDDEGLTETNFIVMDLRRSETRAALDIWWKEIERGSRRDQLSFDYACWKAGAKKIPLISTGLSLRADPRFAYFPHGGKTHPSLDARERLSNLWFEREVAADAEKRGKDVLRVDAIVCVHNSPDDVARCLRSLALTRDGRTRVVIVDDGSESATQAVIARHLKEHPSDVLIRHDEAKGYTKAANAGMRASDADYVVLLNSDTIVPNGWAEALVNAGEANPKIGIVGPLSNAASWQSVPETIQLSGDLAVNDLPEGMSVDDVAIMCSRLPAEPVYSCSVINGFCFAIKRQVINTIGYLDEESFPQGYGEENDYCLRLLSAGFTCGFTLSTYIYHAKSKSFSHERRRVLSQQGWDKLVEKHGKDLLVRVVDEMKEHRALAMARRWFVSQTARLEPKTKAIAFYLPQFHSFPFNDEAWGPGFSEWRNVAKAQPRFSGHSQPLLPGELGFYDLRTPETLERQAKLAWEHGLYGMAIYYYRFGRERLMAAPTDRLLSTPGIRLRFFYCWANEDWTRAWDGRTNDVLLKQDYSDDTLKLLARDLIHACADSRYIRIDDRPVLMIYQLNRLPDPKNIIARLRKLVRDSLNAELVVGTTWNSEFRPEWEPLVDFIAQFPPHRTPRISKRTLLNRAEVPGAQEETADHLESYDFVADQSIEAMDMIEHLAPGTCPDWDNSPRRAKQANILIGSTPEKFQQWTRAASLKAIGKFQAGQLPAPLMFVNAWNEWAEGAIMEPSERNGRAYLRSLRSGIT
ncbi:glycoside hydrolase family 99-like domain-containing protein [Sphingobium sp. Ndbn-10]|uniref:glycoside hydrolase family 99-like domain-containing protein n=1 Tax=Sphingobium sp. Ndbn-10 TaxID=1667223 RepID=UPI0009F50954|nr:glycoside hydrolase family 99-like domain-containing protein [Sphingobium sp. Ndbn-10]